MPNLRTVLLRIVAFYPLKRSGSLPLLALGLATFVTEGAMASPVGLASFSEPQVLQSEQGINAFEVATVKPSPTDRQGWKLQFTVDGFTARNVTLRQLIQEAYGIYEEGRLSGGPEWVDSSKFDVEAKVDSSLAATFAELSIEQRRQMLRALLADRFGLIIRRSTKTLPVFELIVARNGPKMHVTGPQDHVANQIKGMGGLVVRSRRGELEVQDFSMANLAQYLSLSLDRQVIDHTELTQRYNFALHWVPENLAAADNQPGSLPSDPAGPSIFSAIEQQLGLQLHPSKSPIETLAIDHAQRPTEN